MRVPLTARIGLTLILAGAGAYAGIGRWMSTRIVYALDMPISLAAGHIHTGPFRLNLRADYGVFVAIPSSGQWEQANPQCNPYQHLQTRMVLSRDGKTVARQDQPTILPWPTFFEGSPGTYELDVDVLNDFRCVDPIGPRLEIIAKTENYESGAFTLKVAAIVAMYIGFCSLVFVPVVRTAIRISGQRETRIEVADSAPVGQNFQWAQRLPLRRPISGMPGFGLVGGIIFATFAMVMMLLTIPMTPKGLWVHLLKPGAVPAKSDNWTDPLVVRVKYRGPGKEAAVVVNSREVAWDDLNRTLKEELSRRREWVVYVGGDDCVGWSNIAQVIDAARGEQAKVVLVTGDNGKQDCQANFGAKPARR
jgi:biopolymer transport protein ExbD